MYTTHFEATPVEEIYEEIAIMMTRSAPPGWSEAEVEVGMGKDFGEYDARYFMNPQTEEGAFYKLQGSWFNLFYELRRRMKQPDQPTWNKATFRLAPDGQFECSFSYPDESGGEAVTGEVAGLDAIEYVPPPPPPLAIPADLSSLSEAEIDGWFYKVVQDALKGEWSLALLRAEIESVNHGLILMRYREPMEPGELAMDPAPDSVWDLSVELWRRAAQVGEPWSELTVQVTPDGGVRRIYVYPESPVPADLTHATNAQLIDWLREMTEAMIDAPWVRAVAVGRFEEPPQHGGSAVFFHPASAPEAEWATLASGNHNRLFVELWRRWKARGKDWSELQFHLQPDGSYEFEGVLR